MYQFIVSLIRFEYFIYLLALIGLYVIALYLFDNLKSLILIIKSLLDPYFQPQLSKTLIEKYGNWAVVTGSTDGIGKEYSKELAKRGINIILISRSKDKLIQTANEIENEFKVKTKWVVADFSKGYEIYDHIRKELEGMPIGILVNNVGVMYEYPEELSKVPEDVLWNLITINMGACTMMCRMLIDTLKKNGKGAIVNISSASEMQPMPYMAVYSASKIYVKYVTIALQYELAPYGITVQLVTPSYVVTKMNHYSDVVMKGGIIFPDVKSYTKSLVFTLGKTYETTGYWSHGIQYAISKLAPTWLRVFISHQICKQMKIDYLKEKENVKAN